MDRSHLDTLKKRLIDEPRRFIQVLYGPRQVGKTTCVISLIKHYGHNSLFVTADGVINDETWISQKWNIARLKFKQIESREYLLVIDEIQKIQKWSDYLKKEWDEDTISGINIKVLILGSSRMLLQKGLSESLAGRFETIYMGHWSFLEASSRFGINHNQYVYFGTYPGSLPLIDEELRWKDYITSSIIEPSIKKDILLMTRIDKPALLESLFYLGCKYSGSILSYTKMLGQLFDAGNTTTLAHYLSLLEVAGLISGLEKYSTSVIKQRSSSPKFQVQNNSFVGSLSPLSFKEVLGQTTHWGHFVESAIGCHLHTYAHDGKYKLYYWRESNDEVDFVLEKNGILIGIEVKSSQKHGYKGDIAFTKKFNPKATYVISDDSIPWHEFIQFNPAELF